MGEAIAWTALGGVAPSDLTNARLQAHYAVQWPTRAARALIEARADDSHSNLGWDRADKALVSHDLGGGIALGLRIDTLALVLKRGEELIESLPLDGLTDDDAGALVDTRLRGVGLDPASLGDALPYDMPAHPLAGGAVYDEKGAGAGALGEIASWFANADSALAVVRSATAAIKPGPSPVRCWPHHFDLATYISLDHANHENAPAIGVGLSPGDETYHQPYFYVNPWPHLASDDLPPLSPPGVWHTEGFVGAIALGSAIVEQGDQAKATLAYMHEAIAIGRDKLGV